MQPCIFSSFARIVAHNSFDFVIPLCFCPSYAPKHPQLLAAYTWVGTKLMEGGRKDIIEIHARFAYEIKVSTEQKCGAIDNARQLAPEYKC